MFFRKISVLLLLAVSGDADNAVRGDAMTGLYDDDDLGPGKEMVPMEIPRGVHLQATRPLVLDGSLEGRGVIIVILGLGWCGGRIARKAYERTRHLLRLPCGA